MLEVALLVAGSLLQLLGLAGSILPVLAGPPLNFLGLILLCLARGWETFNPRLLIGLAALTIISVFLDYFLPVRGAQKYGSTRWGTWGAFIGLLIGVFFFPPFGLIFGALAGAITGELLAGKGETAAMRAGWGVFLGYFVSLLIRLIASGLMTFFYFRALF